MAAEVPADSLGDEFKGYVFQISGGNDKQGFPMMQGVLTSQRVRLLFSKGMKTYRPRRTGERKRKSVRGCIVSSEIAAMHLVLVKKGPRTFCSRRTPQASPSRPFGPRGRRAGG